MGKKKVLVVEDETDLRELIKEKLEEAGFEVSVAENGAQGLLKAQEIQPHVILSDVIMPEKDGNQFLKELRESDFGKDIPFIVLTARGMMRDYFEVVGVEDFLEKPFDPQELIEKVTIVAEKQPDQAELKKDVSSPGAKKVTQGDRQRSDIVISEEQEAVLQANILDIDAPQQDRENEAQRQMNKIARVERPKISLGTGKKKIIVFSNDMDEFCALQRAFSKSDCASELVCSQEECEQEAGRITPDLIAVKDLPGFIVGEDMANTLRARSAISQVPIIVYGMIGHLEEMKTPTGEKVSAFSFNAQGKELLGKVQEVLSL